MAQRNRGWRLLRDQCRRQRGGLALGIAAGLIWTAAKVSVPKLVESAIEECDRFYPVFQFILWGDKSPAEALAAALVDAAGEA